MTNRKFRFRFWDTKYKRFLSENSFLVLPFDSSEYIAQQFAYLYDEDGKMVFEGDVIHATCSGNRYFNTKFRGVVEWMDEFGFVVSNVKEGIVIEFSDFCCLKEIEIVGNIFDNNESIWSLE